GPRRRLPVALHPRPVRRSPERSSRPARGPRGRPGAEVDRGAGRPVLRHPREGGDGAGAPGRAGRGRPAPGPHPPAVAGAAPARRDTPRPAEARPAGGRISPTGAGHRGPGARRHRRGETPPEITRRRGAGGPAHGGGAGGPQATVAVRESPSHTRSFPAHRPVGLSPLRPHGTIHSPAGQMSEPQRNLRYNRRGWEPAFIPPARKMLTVAEFARIQLLVEEELNSGEFSYGLS